MKNAQWANFGSQTCQSLGHRGPCQAFCSCRPYYVTEKFLVLQIVNCLTCTMTNKSGITIAQTLGECAFLVEGNNFKSIEQGQALTATATVSVCDWCRRLFLSSSCPRGCKTTTQSLCIQVTSAISRTPSSSCALSSGALHRSCGYCRPNMQACIITASFEPCSRQTPLFASAKNAASWYVLFRGITAIYVSQAG